MIAPDPSPTLTETPACGMNSWNEWTVFRETMSFHGVAHDRLLRVVADRDAAVRATVSTSLVPAEADRPIGVWCVPPVTNPVWRNRKMKRSRNPENRFGLESPRKGTRNCQASTRPGAWINDYSPSNEKGSQKSQEINGTRKVRSLDIRGHIGVRHVHVNGTPKCRRDVKLERLLFGFLNESD